MPYCSKCGAKLGEGYMFCNNCGQPINSTAVTENSVSESEHHSTPVALPDNTALNCTMIDYINEQIRKSSVYIDAMSYINGTKTVAVGALTRRFMENREQYEIPGNKSYNLDDLAVKLSQGLSSLPFSEWKKGNPAPFGLRITSEDVIQFTFNNQTIHRIVFDSEKKGFYKIEAVGATKKERLKYMSSRDGLVLKNLTKIKPIIQYAVEYCFYQI